MKKILFSALPFPSAILSAQLDGLKDKFYQLTEGKKAVVSVAVMDLKTGEETGIREDSPLPTLSVFKFHIALATLQLVDEGKLSLNQKIQIRKEQLLPETWSPIREKYPDGNVSLSLEQLLKYMAADSDNNATDIILDLIGGTKIVENYCKKKGIEPFQIKHNEASMHIAEKHLYENTTTTQAMVKAFRKLEQGSLLLKPTTKVLRDIMLGTTTGTDKLKEQLPKNTKIAHKTGASGRNSEGLTIAENDAGIIYPENGNDYAIAVFVIDSYETSEVNKKIISDISKVVFDYFSSKK